MSDVPFATPPPEVVHNSEHVLDTHGPLSTMTKAAPLPSKLPAVDLNWRNFYTRPLWPTVTKELLSGTTVALAMVPEAVAFAFVAGVEPLVGLHAAWILGLVTSILGGRPGSVTGASGATAVVMVDLVADYGVEFLFYAVFLGGVWQILFGVFRLSRFARMISASVMMGFGNGLAIVIGLAQLGSYQIRPEDEDNNRRRLVSSSSFDVFTNDSTWVTGSTALWMALLTVLSVCIIMLMPKLTKAFPSSLMALMVATILEHALIRPLGYETRTVEDIAEVSGGFPIPPWFDDQYTMPPVDWDTFTTVLPVSISLAAVAVSEGLMAKNLIDEITQTRTSGDKEMFGQGVGNILCGLFGTMGGDTLTGQAIVNVTSGGTRRLSTTFASLLLLLIILIASPLINFIPMASLAGVMFGVVINTFSWHSLPILWYSFQPQCLRKRQSNHAFRKIRRADAIAILLVTVFTVLFNLAVAVGVGIAYCSLAYAWDSTTSLHMYVREEDRPLDGFASRKTSITEAELEADLANVVSKGDAAAAGEGASDAAGVGSTGDESKSSPEATPSVDVSKEDGVVIEMTTVAGAGTSSSPQPDGEDVVLPSGAPARQRVKVYEPRGQLFFGSISRFLSYFDFDNDPDYVEIHFKRSAVLDFSALDAVNTLAARYGKVGKELRLRHLSAHCHKQFAKASKLLHNMELDAPVDYE